MYAANRFAITTLLLAALLLSCGKRKPGPPPPAGARAESVYVVCEGALGNGNSALSLYRPDVDSAYEDVYKSANGSAPGDVFQSITKTGEQLFLCINNSDRIISIDRQTFRVNGSMTVPKPRYILPVSASKAFVSTLFSDKIYVINPATLQVLRTVTMPHQNPEDMMLINGKVYVACWDTACRSIYTIDTASFGVATALALGQPAPQELETDNAGNLWVLCGNVAKGKSAALVQTSVSAGTVLKTLSFPPSADPLRLEANAARDTLYYLLVSYDGSTANNGVYRMPVAAGGLPALAFVAAQNLQYFWGLGIDRKTGGVYVADPKGFTQRGEVLIYRPDGTMLRRFKSGVGPGHFLFD